MKFQEFFASSTLGYLSIDAGRRFSGFPFAFAIVVDHVCAFFNSKTTTYPFNRISNHKLIIRNCFFLLNSEAPITQFTHLLNCYILIVRSAAISEQNGRTHDMLKIQSLLESCLYKIEQNESNN